MRQRVSRSQFARIVARWIAVAILSGTAGCITPTTDRAELDDVVVERERALQRRLVIGRELEYERRLARVAYPVLRAATPLCVNDLGRGIGFRFANVFSYESEYRIAAAEVLGIDEQVRVIDVSPDSAAAAAGLQPGFAITSINGADVGAGRFALPAARRALDEAATAGGPIEFVLSVDDEERVVSLTPDPICYFPVQLINDDVINAFADGRNIYVTRGMMRFASEDDDLALVIAHELAHNAMAHIEAQRTNRMMGQVVDLAAKAYGVDTRGVFTTIAMRSRSEAFEAEADYVALYAMALAGLPIGEAADFWRMMAIEHPESIEEGYMATHPSTAERYVAIDTGIEEVIAKQSAGEELMPNLRRFVSRFEKPPLAFETEVALDLDTRSGRPVVLPAGCWRRVGETRYGVAYIPEAGTLEVHGERAALVVSEAQGTGLWKINRSRFLALDQPLVLDEVAEPLFECGDATPISASGTQTRPPVRVDPARPALRVLGVGPAAP